MSALDPIVQVADEQVDLADLTQLAPLINKSHAAVMSTARTALECAHCCGVLLGAAKAQLKHGAWLPWLKANTAVSPRTAQVYMQVADHYDEIVANAQTSAHLSMAKVLNYLATKRQRQAITGASAVNVASVESTTDTPERVLPPDLVERLAHLHARRDTLTAWAHDAERQAEEYAQELLQKMTAKVWADVNPRLQAIDDEIATLTAEGQVAA